MRNRVRLRITPATVIASIALLVALGGTSIAAVTATAPSNSVNTAALKNSAVTNPKIANNAVTGSKVKNGSLQKADFASGQIPAGKTGPPGPEGPAGPAGAAGATGPAGPSDAFARFLNGPIAVPAAATTLTSLSIPSAGKYVIWAKAYLVSTGQGVVTCALVAATDTDQTQTWVQAGLPFALSNIVTHEFTAAGTVDFRCQYPGTGTTTANQIKVAAIKVANLTNSG